MNNFNFVSNYPSLKKWERESLFQDEFNNKDSSKKFNKFSITPDILLETIKTQKFLLIPPLSVLSLTLIIFIISLYPRLNVMRLSNKNNKFENLYSEIKDTNESINQTSNYLSKFINTYNIKSPVLLFSYFLQESVPEDVIISDYSVDNNNFIVNASSNDLDSINKFINLINQLPLTMRNSLQVKKLINNVNNPNNIQSFQQTSSLGNINVEIIGGLNLISLEEKLKLYKNIYNFGEVRKIEQFLNLINTFKI